MNKVVFFQVVFWFVVFVFILNCIAQKQSPWWQTTMWIGFSAGWLGFYIWGKK